MTAHDQAFVDLYERYFTFVWRTLRYFDVAEDQRADLAQEVWLVVHRRLSELRDPERVRAWIWSITRRVVTTHRRTRRRATRRERAIERATSPVTPSVDSQVIARKTIDEVLSQLPGEQREVLLLACHGGLTGPEIADVLELGVNTVYSRLRLARQRIDQAIADTYGDDDPPEYERQRCLAVVLGPGALAWTPHGSPPSLAPGKLAAVKLGSMTTAVAAVAAALLMSSSSQPRAAEPTDSPPEVAAGRDAVDDSRVPPDPVRDVSSSPKPTDPKQPATEPAPRAPQLDEDEDEDEDENEGPATAPVPRRGRRIERRRNSTAAPHQDQRAKPSASTETPLARELAVLSPAVRRVETDPAAALRMLQTHTERFPDSELWDITERARVRALCRLGRDTDASRLVAGLASRGDVPVAVTLELKRCPDVDKVPG